MENPFSWDYLTTVPGSDDVFDLWASLFLVVMAFILVAGFLLYLRPQVMWSRRMLRIQSARRWGWTFIWISFFGFFFFLVGWLQINPFTFGERIWLLITLIIALIALTLMVVQIQVESKVLSQERAASQAAMARGIHTRRPPRRSRNKKR